MIDEAKKTTEILRKRAAQNVYVNTSPGSIRRLARLIEQLVQRIEELEGNPCRQIERKNKERPRTAVPDAAELEAFAQWMQAQGVQRRVIGMMAEFIALTGNRRV